MLFRNYLTVIFVTAFLLAFSAVAEEPAVNAEPVETRTQEPSRVVADQLLLDQTSVRGNQELPRIMTIVPWKDAELGDVVGKPVNSLIDEVLNPVDRDVFLRQTKYFNQLYESEKSLDR